MISVARLATTLSIGIVITTTLASAQTTFFVDDNGSDTNNGLGWGTAFRTLQKGLDVAAVNDDIVLVAHGTYGTLQSGVSGPITLVDDVATHGGFTGGGSTNPDAPDGSFTSTHISGEVFTGDSDSVVKAVNVSNATLDGFVIEYGTWSDGAGLYSDDPYQLHIENITFRYNVATGAGGAIYVVDGWQSEVLEDFGLEIDRCTFYTNRAVHGGGLFMASPNDGAFTAAVMSNSIFYDNGYDGITTAGGAIYCSPESYLAATNCLLHNNYADEGGGVYVEPRTGEGNGARVFFSNSTISRNTSASLSAGAGIHMGPSGTTYNILNVSNSIVHGNLCTCGNFAYDVLEETGSSNLLLTYTAYGTNSGAYIYTGCINSNPQFVNAPAANFHLKTSPLSPCIDTGSDVLVYDDIADVDEDGVYNEILPFDLDVPNVRIANHSGMGGGNIFVDMGCYEVQD